MDKARGTLSYNRGLFAISPKAIIYKVESVDLWITLQSAFIGKGTQQSKMYSTLVIALALGLAQAQFTPPEGGFTRPEGGFTPPEGFTRPEGGFTPPEGFTRPEGGGGFTTPAGGFTRPEGGFKFTTPEGGFTRPNGWSLF